MKHLEVVRRHNRLLLYQGQAKEYYANYGERQQHDNPSHKWIETATGVVLHNCLFPLAINDAHYRYADKKAYYAPKQNSLIVFGKQAESQ